MSTPDERPSLSAVIEHNTYGELRQAEVMRGKWPILNMYLAADFDDMTLEAGRAFDEQAERLCRLFALGERMEAALRAHELVDEHIAQCNECFKQDDCFCEEAISLDDKAATLRRSVLGDLSEAARGEEGTR